MQLFEYVDGIEKKLAHDATLADRIRKLYSSHPPADTIIQDSDISDEYVDVARNPLDGARAVSERFATDASSSSLLSSCSLQ